MPTCPDCGDLMISQGEETFKRKQWIIFECISCGASIRVPKYGGSIVARKQKRRD